MRSNSESNSLMSMRAASHPIPKNKREDQQHPGFKFHMHDISVGLYGFLLHFADLGKLVF